MQFMPVYGNVTLWAWNCCRLCVECGSEILKGNDLTIWHEKVRGRNFADTRTSYPCVTVELWPLTCLLHSSWKDFCKFLEPGCRKGQALLVMKPGSQSVFQVMLNALDGVEGQGYVEASQVLLPHSAMLNHVETGKGLTQTVATKVEPDPFV